MVIWLMASIQSFGTSFSQHLLNVDFVLGTVLDDWNTKVVIIVSLSLENTLTSGKQT
jgi:hypothetical protein